MLSTQTAVPQSAADSQLQLRVVNTLAALHVPSFRALRVQAQDGVVVLHGRVKSYYEKQLAHTRARNVSGVVAVLDSIVVADAQAPLALTGLHLDREPTLTASARAT
jgi:osmotically-inducible protein OsmY